MTWKTAFYSLGVLPWGFTVSLLAFYFHARAILGQFPSYNQPDPKETRDLFRLRFVDRFYRCDMDIFVYGLASGNIDLLDHETEKYMLVSHTSWCYRPISCHECTLIRNC